MKGYLQLNVPQNLAAYIEILQICEFIQRIVARMLLCSHGSQTAERNWQWMSQARLCDHRAFRPEPGVGQRAAAGRL